MRERRGPAGGAGGGLRGRGRRRLPSGRKWTPRAGRSGRELRAAGFLLLGGGSGGVAGHRWDSEPGQAAGARRACAQSPRLTPQLICLWRSGRESDLQLLFITLPEAMLLFIQDRGP
ncbi:hypothetical protein NDU88_010730 [Pleurodeles waltl]|uniref:Uncharacterized protein n=1 Tax=Pleurodeles waltl TaxID=8319 RepID=A0AAV7S0G9_PLEWA|nr:hypothetical protein NDU88_010730 [Pleurodeles waltl]